MTNIRKYWSVFALVLTFAVGFVLRELAPTPVQAANGPIISGTVSVSNFPATQPVSGSVSVSNFPGTQAVSLSGTPTVKVTNTATPLSVTAADNPGLQPFTQECSGPISGGLGGNALCYIGAAALPSGSRFVIETVSAKLNTAAGVKPIIIGLQTCANGVSTNNYFPAAFQGSSGFPFTGDWFAVNQQVRLYADSAGGCSSPGTSTFTVQLSTATDGTFDVTLSGHMVTTP